MRKESTGEQLDTLPDTAGACNGCRLIVLQAGNAGCQPGCTLLLLVRQRDAHCAARRGHPPAGFPQAAGRWQGLHYLRTSILIVCPTAPLYNWAIMQHKIMVSVPRNRKECIERNADSTLAFRSGVLVAYLKACQSPHARPLQAV